VVYRRFWNNSTTTPAVAPTMDAPNKASCGPKAAIDAMTTMKLGLTLGDDGSRIDEFSATTSKRVKTASGTRSGSGAPPAKNSASVATPAQPQSTSYHHPGSTVILVPFRTAVPIYNRREEEVERTHRHVRDITGLPTAEASATGQNDRKQAGEDAKSLTHLEARLLETLCLPCFRSDAGGSSLRSRNKAMRPADSLFSSVVNGPAGQNGSNGCFVGLPPTGIRSECPVAPDFDCRE
jgi:hypothetical protein